MTKRKSKESLRPRDRKCTVLGCGKKHHANGLCHSHYGAKWNSDHKKPSKLLLKSCSIDGCINKYYSNGFCRSHYSRAYYEINKLQKIMYRESNKDIISKNDKIRALKRYYKTTPMYYAKLFEEQQGKCLGCNKHQSNFKKRLAVDHDHETGKIRGLLCQQCNVIIGLAYEDPEILISLANYIRQ